MADISEPDVLLEGCPLNLRGQIHLIAARVLRLLETLSAMISVCQGKPTLLSYLCHILGGVLISSVPNCSPRFPKGGIPVPLISPIALFDLFLA